MVDFKKNNPNRPQPEMPEASTKNMTLLVTKYDNAESTSKNKEGEEKTSHWLDAQALQTPGANEHLPRQANPNLYTKANDRGGYDHQRPYSEGQWDAIKEAGGTEHPLNDKDGNKVGSAYVVNADLVVRPKAPIVLNTKTLQPAPEGLEIPENVVDRQFEGIRENIAEVKAFQAERQSEGAEAPEQAEAPEAEAESSDRDSKGRFTKKEEQAAEKSADEPDFA